MQNRDGIMGVVLELGIACTLLCYASTALAQAPGGWVEPYGAGVRTQLNREQIAGFVPQRRGAFAFPSPYNTEAVRITDASDCVGASDCLNPVGYSYWRNTNNHVGSDEMLLFFSLDRSRGGAGPTLFRFDKSNHTIAKLGPLFEPTHRLSWRTGEGWYFSASRPHTLYVNDGPTMLRYDVMTHDVETVFDVTATMGTDKSIWQMHSSNDDTVHSATLRIESTGEVLGCIVYDETRQRFSFFSNIGLFDECSVDKSGHWLLSLENIDGRNGEDMRIFDLTTDTEIRRILDEDGAVGHADLGYGYVVGADNWNNLPNATVLWHFGQPVVHGPIIHRNINWTLGVMNHISHANAKADLPMGRQFVCGSTADRSGVQNEITCARLDGVDRYLIVAPVMTNLNSPGGLTEYRKLPKGNLDVTGQYFVWTTNLSASRLDAFLVHVPSQLLVE